jgi:hypothetical protein
MHARSMNDREVSRGSESWETAIITAPTLFVLKLRTSYRNLGNVLDSRTRTQPTAVLVLEKQFASTSTSTLSIEYEYDPEK